jgi:methyltransferase-like protein/SAM-dependent methyltransferase
VADDIAVESAAAVEALRTDYDEAPYESYSHPHSAPGHLAAIAWIFGLDSADLATARVLEIGCAAAGNLIPFAAMYPDARVVGIDLSRVHIELARQRIRALGLNNVELVVGDIGRMDLTGLGLFDFIICHGVYSWVPSEVQGQILSACRQLLALDGVAYLSYNVYPGWKAKEIVRDAMLLRVPPSASPDERVRHAREAVDFLEQVTQPDGVVARALADYRALAAETGDYYLLHEELEAFNNPCYFRDFVDRAREHGLDYLAEAQPEYMFVPNYGPTVVDGLVQYGHDRVLLEQHLDFVVNRAFRETLLVHAARAVDIRHRLDHNRFDRLHVSAFLPPAADGPRLDNSVEQYGDPNNGTMIASDPVAKAALAALNDQWPWTLSRQDVADGARARLVAAAIQEPVDLEARIDGLLEALISHGLARCRLEPVAPTADVTSIRLDEPARLMAALTRDHAEAFVINHWHETMPLEPLDRYLLPLLDGSRDRDELVEALLEVFRHNVIRIDLDDEQESDPNTVREVLAQQVDALPDRLAELRLLRVVDGRPFP